MSEFCRATNDEVVALMTRNETVRVLLAFG